jgi:EAL domain-containing protein (putative c-di-GMP-specific phosphodiesterase class I)
MYAAAGLGQLVLHYQPIVRLDDRTVVAAEALLRWQHPDRGWLPPSEFMQLAEDSGAIVDLGRWVLQQACRDAAAWERRGAAEDWRGVGVNLSRRQLDSPTLVDDVAAALRESGLPPHQLTLEITETALAEDVTHAIAVMERLLDLGVGLAMDDFGTGYSSLADLQRMPIDVLKIDRAFVEGIARSEEEWALTSAVVGLATSLGKRTLAEGIEEPAQLAHLRSLGCELGQGYLFARPMAVEEFQVGYLPGYAAATGERP